MKKIAVLGSTGSIGINTLKVLDNLKDYKIECLTAHSSIQLLAKQANRYKVPLLGIGEKENYPLFTKYLEYKPKEIFFGAEGLKNFCRDNNCREIVIAIVGFAGLIPLIESIKKDKKIILANKEPLVCAGKIIMDLLKKHKAEIIPVDSEHNAIFQCLNGEDTAAIKRIILTASGGPFSDFKFSDLSSVTPARALAHPRWKMGKKITIDSATLMNKGFEVIEAKWLFGVDVEKIEVLIHKEAIIHSMVEFTDGSVMAQLSNPDMRLPIQYALTFPQRKPSALKSLDFSEIGNLTFTEPDTGRFPCLKLAYKAVEKGGTYPCALNAADEELVHAYLNEKIKFTDIPKIIEKVLAKHKSVEEPGLEEILEADISVRQLTKKYY
ncbi:MAG: 1-deoxy-D-xylulose-5-phosphate reductoisomerase [Candidatus Omnitrophota bacterium]